MAMHLPRGRVTDIIVGVTFAAFLLARISHESGPLTAYAGFIPARVAELGPSIGALTLPWVPVWLTPLTATLLHGGWLHVGLNLMILIFCGRQVEHLLGTRGYLILYAAGAYAAAAAQWLAAPGAMEPMIGASGAISAVIGTYALVFNRNEVRAIGPFSPQVVRIAWLAAGWTVLQLMIAMAGPSFGTLGAIAIWAHIGGFFAGLLLARPLLALRFRTR